MLQELQRQHEEHKARRARLMTPPKVVQITQSDPEAQLVEVITKAPDPNNDLAARLQKLELAVFGMERVEAPVRRGVREIIKHTAKHYNVPFLDIIAARRTGEIIMPRHVAMYLAKTITGHSFPYIGRLMGGRDHTTVMHGVRKITAQLEWDDDLARDVAAIKQSLEQAE
jgi:hypothetical protein